MKKVKKSTRSKNFYLSIKDGIKENKSITQISKGLNVSKQRLNYYLSSLKQFGFIKKIGYGCWELIEDFNIEQVKKLSRVAPITPRTIFSLKPNMVRGHAFVFTLQLPMNLRNWNKREGLLIKLGIKFKPIGNFGGGQSIEFRRRKVHLTNKSIIIYERENIIGELARDIHSKVINHFLILIRALEKLLRGNFSHSSKYKFKVSRAHYSLIKNSLAKQYNSEGKKLEVYNDKGLWFVIDNSFNLNELEIIQNKEGEQKAIDRNEGMQRWVKEMDETDFEVTPKFILKIMNGIQQNQLVFDRNMTSHLQVLQEIRDAIKEFRETKER